MSLQYKVLILLNVSLLQRLVWPISAHFQQGKNLIMLFIVSKHNSLQLIQQVFKYNTPYRYGEAHLLMGYCTGPAN